MCDEKEEFELATKALDFSYALSETDANKILTTPRKRIKEMNVFNDLKLPRAERIKLAKSILDSRKK